MKHRTFLTVFSAVCLTVIMGALFWGKGMEHWQGDPGLSRDFFFAGDYFATFGLKSWGLAMYNPDGEPYTHLTAGPEWIQGLLALLRQTLFAKAGIFHWHSVSTALLSLLLACLGLNLTGKLAVLYLRRNAIDVPEKILEITGLLFLTTTSVLIFSAHPYCLGGIASDVVTLWACLYWCKNPSEDKMKKAIGLMCASVFFAFWMGLSPVTSSFFISILFIHTFGSEKTRTRRLVWFLFSAASAVALAATIKIFQNYLYFQSWEQLFEDLHKILKTRQGLAGDTVYSVGMHILKIVWRAGYLFGAMGVFFFWLLNQTRKTTHKPVRHFSVLLLLAGISWQFFMRHHGYHHIYLLRLALFPLVLGFILTLALAVHENAVNLKKFRKIALFAALAQFAGILFFVVIPGFN